MDFFDSEMVLGFAKVVIVLICLLPVIYYVTRWYGKVQKSSSTVSVKERIPLGANRCLYVVEWAGNKYLVAFTNQQITVIDRLSGTDAPAHREGGEQPSFQN